MPGNCTYERLLMCIYCGPISQPHSPSAFAHAGHRRLAPIHFDGPRFPERGDPTGCFRLARTDRPELYQRGNSLDLTCKATCFRDHSTVVLEGFQMAFSKDRVWGLFRERPGLVCAKGHEMSNRRETKACSAQPGRPQTPHDSLRPSGTSFPTSDGI